MNEKLSFHSRVQIGSQSEYLENFTDNLFDISDQMNWLRLYLFLGGCEHGDDGEADGLDGERRAPVVRQDRQADVTVAV